VLALIAGIVTADAYFPTTAALFAMSLSYEVLQQEA